MLGFGGKKKTGKAAATAEGSASANIDTLIDGLAADVAATGETYWNAKAQSLPTFARVKELNPDQTAEFVALAIRRCAEAALAYSKKLLSSRGKSIDRDYAIMQACEAAAWAVLRSAIECSAESMDKVCRAAAPKRQWTWQQDSINGLVLKSIERFEGRLSPVMTGWLEKMVPIWSATERPDMARIKRARMLLGEREMVSLEPGEAWSDAAIALIANAGGKSEAWIALIDHCHSAASGAAPSGKWLKSTAALVKPIGEERVRAALVEWFPLVDKPRTAARQRLGQYDPDWTNRIIDPHMEVLKGLCWIAGTIKDADLARALGRLALSCYRKVPGLGPRATKVGNAAVTALGGMPGMDSVGQLAMLRVKVKFGTAQKMIEKALNAAAEREGLPRDEIEELGVPSYGLTEVGKRTETLGEFTAEMVASGVGDVELKFLKPDGKGGMKAYASVPAAVKTEFAEDLKDLKAAAKDIAAMLPAQRDRIDAMFLENKSWAMGVWRERYLDHPLVGVLARRLIWRVSDGKGDTARAVTWLDEAGALVGVDGKPVTIDEVSAIVRLWHPIDTPQDEVLAWRRFFEERQIRQPFKQAHREVYLLTDAERRTETYSNRFAAHIIRQHQFNALCGVRGWKNKLRLMVDGEYPPAHRNMTAHNLRAEYWIEGIGEGYGEDTNEAGVYNLLVTDQVRFYAIDAALPSAHAGGGGYGGAWGQGELAHGLAIEQIPALVLSEILRDVDLFVGVCSVGNNPQWQDGGPGGAHRDYWQNYSFGDLTEAGKGRYDILSRLLPRLKIAARCSLGEKFLTVRGTLRAYKIHLGSGNILMEPNDQYLCIVPSSSVEAKTGGQVFLPFEGDRTLAIILSKAFMLAADDKITDSSIVRQIKG